MASDFHTHHLPAPGVKALVSAETAVSGVYTSLEIHPWYLPADYSENAYSVAAKLPEFHALGEVGLDKMRGPDLTVQQKYLAEFLQIAADMDKPVVLHAVKCYQEIFSLLKKFKVRAMLHGFCGSLELLDELWKRQITVSFSEKAVLRQEIISKLATNTGAYGFESDAAQERDVRQIMSRTKIKNVETITDRYFADFLRI